MSAQVPSPKLPSDRSVGLLFTTVAVVAGAWLLLAARPLAGAALLAVGVALLAVSLAAPRRLAPLNRAWMKLAELLHRVVSPIVLGVMFFGLIAPVAIGMRLFGRDALARRFDRAARSYWIERVPPGPGPDSFPRQY